MNINEKVIGVAGCGSMGLPMAQCLSAAGYDVLGYDVRPVTEFAEFADRMVIDPNTFAEKIDVLISVVRDVRQTDDLLFEVQALLNHAQAPTTIVVSSTLSPRYIRDLAERLPAGRALVDAPMSGAPYRARQGDLTFMVGGDASLVSSLMPMFRVMGERVTHLGPVSHGMTVKVLNNYCAATGLVATRRVLAMAAHLAIDPRQLLAVMGSSSGSNWYADHIDEIDWSGEGYALDNTIGIVEKDVRSALDAITAIPVDASSATQPWPLDDALLEGLQGLTPLDLSQSEKLQRQS